MLRQGMRSSGLALARGGQAEVNALPNFLCPRLTNVDVIRIRNYKPSNSKRQRNFASTSKIASFSSEIDLLLQEDDQVPNSPKTSADYADIVSKGLGLQNDVERNKLQGSKRMDDLTITHEIIDDIITREQAFNSKAESMFLLEEGRSIISARLKGEDQAIRKMVQSTAPKLAFAYLKLRQPTITIAITQDIVATWTEEEEKIYCNSWKPVVSLAYIMGLYDEAAQLANLLCLHSSFSGNWMSLARLQSMLRMAEDGQHHHRADINNVSYLWKEYEERGIPVSETAMVILLDSQVRRGDIGKITQTLATMRRHNIHITSDIWRVLFFYSARGKSRKESLKLIIDSLNATTLLVEKMIDAFAGDDNLRDCLRVFRMFGIPTGSQNLAVSKVSPTLKMYSRMIEMTLKTKRPLHAVRFLNLAIQTSCQGNYTPLFMEINSALNDSSKAEEAVFVGVSLINSPLRQKFQSASISILSNSTAMIESSAPIYGAILTSISHISNTNAIVPATKAILLEVFAQNIAIDDTIRKALTRIVVRFGRYGDAQAMARYLEELFIRLDTKKRPYAEEWNKFVLEMQKQGVAEELTLVAWEKTASTSGKYKPGFIPWTQSKASIGIPFHGPIKSAIQVDHKEDTNEITHRIAFKDLELDANLSPKAFAMRIKIFAVLRKEFNNALTIYQSMAANGVQASMHHVAPLIEGLILVDRLQDAHMIKERAKVEISNSGIPLRIYAALVRGYGQRKDWHGLLSLGTEMKNEKIKINRYFQAAFQRAKRMLRREAMIASKNDDVLAFEKINSLTQQPLPVPQEDLVKPLTVLEATFQFNEYHHNGQTMIAHKYLSKSLDQGLIPDGHLRDTLSRCDNWLRKSIETLKEKKSSIRNINHLEECLQLCHENRKRMKMSKEREILHLNLRRQEEKQRGFLIRLLKFALAKEGLWKQAQSREDVKKKESINSVILTKS